MKISKLRIPISLLTLSLLIIVLFTVVLHISNSQSAKSSKAAPDVGFNGIQLYKGILNKGNAGDTVLTGSIYTGTGAPNLDPGFSVVVGIATVGNGAIDVNDNENNIYTLIGVQKIDPYSSVYVFRSILTNTLKPYDTITVHSTSAKSLAITALAFHGVTNIAQETGNSGLNSSPISSPLYTNPGNLVLVVTGFRSKPDFSASYAPYIQVLSGADSGTAGSSLDNSIIRIDGFMPQNTDTYVVPTLISNLKSRSGVPWGNVGLVFN
jgi:hypothetical protein